MITHTHTHTHTNSMSISTYTLTHTQAIMHTLPCTLKQRKADVGELTKWDSSIYTEVYLQAQSHDWQMLQDALIIKQKLTCPQCTLLSGHTHHQTEINDMSTMYTAFRTRSFLNPHISSSLLHLVHSVTKNNTCFFFFNIWAFLLKKKNKKQPTNKH